MSPRSSKAEARANRAAIVDTAMALAASEGIHVLTLGRVAREVEMSKAGVIGHFGTMEALELEAVGAAIDHFTRAVWQPAAGKAAGLPRLRVICDRWIDYLGSADYAGGCLSSAEHSASPEVRQAVADALARWRQLLAAEVAAAVAAGALPADSDPIDAAFQLSGAALSASQSLRLGLDRRARARGRRAMKRALNLQ